MSIEVNTFTQDESRIVRVHGEVDVSNATDLRAALDEVLANGPQGVEVDLAQVPYIDSTGIGVLVGVAHRCKDAGVGFAVRNPQRNVARVFSLLGVDEELGIG